MTAQYVINRGAFITSPHNRINYTLQNLFVRKHHPVRGCSRRAVRSSGVELAAALVLSSDDVSFYSRARDSLATSAEWEEGSYTRAPEMR